MASGPDSRWVAYGDPVLDGLVKRALSNNLDIKAAAQRVEQARALTGEAKGALQPSINLNAGALRLRGGYQAGVARVPQGGDSENAPMTTIFIDIYPLPVNGCYRFCRARPATEKDERHSYLAC